MDRRTEAVEAGRILNNEVYRTAKANAEERIWDEWKRTTGQAQREALWFRHQALDDVDRELRILRDGGTLADHKERQQ